MSIISRILGSPNAVKKGLDAVVNTGDALVFTKEEKAEYYLKLLRAYEPFKIAQRFLALIVGIPYVTVWLLCVTLYMCSVFSDPCSTDQVCKAQQIREASIALADRNNNTLGIPFSIILGFYFGGGMIEGGIRAAAEGGRKK